MKTYLLTLFTLTAFMAFTSGVSANDYFYDKELNPGMGDFANIESKRQAGTPCHKTSIRYEPPYGHQVIGNQYHVQLHIDNTLTPGQRCIQRLVYFNFQFKVKRLLGETREVVIHTFYDKDLRSTRKLLIDGKEETRFMKPIPSSSSSLDTSRFNNRVPEHNIRPLQIYSDLMIAPFGPGNNYCNPMEGGFNTGLRFRVFNSGTVNTPETTLETSGLNCPFVNSYPVPALTPKTDTYINVPNCKKVSEGRYTFKVWVNRGFRDFKEKVNGQPNVQSVTCQIIF